MRKIRWAAALLALCMLCSCGTTPSPEENPDAIDEVPLVTDVRGTVLSQTLEDGPRALLEDYMNSWYRSEGSFEVEDLSALFTEEEDARFHEGICRSIAAIRAEAPEDLKMERCRWQLEVTDVDYDETEGTIYIRALEDATMRFAGIEVDSEMFDNEHYFTLSDMNGVWKIAAHEDRYSELEYDEDTCMDKNMETYLANVRERQAQHSLADPVLPECDHPYDCEAALRYMNTYADHRNPDWLAYDDYGGNCMNFTSQTLLAGGIPMKYEEDPADGWHWEGMYDCSISFVNVEEFHYFASTNTGSGLVALADAPYYSGQVGDLILMGSDAPDHATQICGLVQDEQGNTIDYLLCSNTTNYRNFPAAAYYFTWHTLVRICGWND